MNITFPEQLYVINCQKIQRDRAFILKEKMIRPQSNFGVMLNALGAWMIAKGEQLRKHHSISGQINPLAFLHDEANIFRA